MMCDLPVLLQPFSYLGCVEGPPPLPCILQKCVIAEWPGWFVFEKRLKVVKMAKTDKMFLNGSKWSNS